jgi:hypothetical protein
MVVVLTGYCLRSVHRVSVRAAGTPPSAESVAAAMENQEKPGMSLQVRYSWKSSSAVTKPGVRAKMVTDCYYVRTPEAIFLKERVIRDSGLSPVTTPGRFSGSYTATKSYDRATGEYRELTKFDGSPPQGVTDSIKTHLNMVSRLMVRMNLSYHGTSEDLEQMTRVESVVDYIFGASLYEIVRDGIVLEKKKIDGHNCWAVVHDTIPDVQRCVIWVDPDIGFCPRRIDLIMNKQLRRSQTMRDYRQIGNGVWFPREVVFEAFSKTGKLHERSTITVDDARLVRVGPKVKLQVTFPPGVDIMHRERQKQQTP